MILLATAIFSFLVFCAYMHIEETKLNQIAKARQQRIARIIRTKARFKAKQSYHKRRYIRIVC